MEYFVFQLPNGIRCVYRQSRTAAAYCGLTINAGSRDELASEHGIAHLIEHSIFKGTARRKAYQINCRLENLGGELNAYTTKEETVVHATTLRGDFARAAELVADVVFRATFPPKEVEREKEVILDEINTYKESPAERIYDEFEDRIFSGSSLGHNILGNKKSVLKQTSSDICAFRQRTYNTDQMVFSAVGSFGPKRFRDVCERFFSDIPANPRAFQREAPVPVLPFEEVRRHRTFQAHCLLGSRAYSHGDERRVALSLLVNLLGGLSSNSLLNIALRERNGFTYNIEANYTPFSDTGIASIYFGTDKDKIERCLEIIDGEIGKIIAGKITPRQFSMAKKQFIGQFLLSMESNEGNMLSAGKSLLIYNRIDTTAEIVQRIRALTQADLIEVARDIYAPPLSMLIYR
jgi:predicted Zn-dependent peptidase